MAIENRNLVVGTRLVGRYKSKKYSAMVVEGEGGTVRFRLGDGREFKSLSAAGSAVMQGHACNGWRFWSLAPEQVEAVNVEVEAASKTKGKTNSDVESNFSKAATEERQAD